ncbi:hypothetical protein BGZ96_000533 [Linnemannia gamsii]|uniref:Uncharacterized protein n=1 Tax=Linnemannia gamsii TaxID=64522 RepID=A0ABQ7JNV7_9FUNG|nr:hypothetical protein BGZ96_000533 [Linnemannia gamsii]
MNKEDRQGNINNATKSNGNSKDANINLNSTGSVATEHVEWALKKIAVRAKITMPGFANDFGFYSEQDAHSAFSNLFLSTNLLEATRLRLQERYKVWRGNHGIVFWANRVASFQTTITLKRTAGEVVAGTQRIAKKLILEEANNLAQSLTDSEADDSSNTLGALPSGSIRSRSSAPTSPSTGIDILDSEENRPPASPLPRRRYLQDSDDTTGDDNATNRIQTDHQDAHLEDEQASDLAHSDDSLDLEEIDDLVASITSIEHKECDKWVLDGRCVPCMVDDYKESAIEALRASELRKTEPADVIELEEAVEALDGVKKQKAEATVPADRMCRWCSPISPNTNSNTQKEQGNKPDRPDFKVMIGEKEVSFGEVTGPTQRNDKKKNGWDPYRLSRFGTAVLNEGAPVVPLIQVVADVGTVYRHFVKARGIMVLAEVGVFSVPTATIHVGALLASLPTLFWYQECTNKLDSVDQLRLNISDKESEITSRKDILQDIDTDVLLHLHEARFEQDWGHFHIIRPTYLRYSTYDCDIGTQVSKAATNLAQGSNALKLEIEELEDELEELKQRRTRSLYDLELEGIPITTITDSEAYQTMRDRLTIYHKMMVATGGFSLGLEEFVELAQSGIHDGNSQEDSVQALEELWANKLEFDLVNHATYKAN